MGQEIEHEFTNKAKLDNLTEDERINAFNRNMMSTGFLTNGAKEFGKQHSRRWLVTAYEAGDVVFHKPHMVGFL